MPTPYIEEIYYWCCEYMGGKIAPSPIPADWPTIRGSEDARNGQRDFYCPVSVYRATAFDGSDGNEWPFWPLHLESMTSTELLSIAGTGVYIAPMLGVMLTSTFWGG